MIKFIFEQILKILVFKNCLQSTSYNLLKLNYKINYYFSLSEAVIVYFRFLLTAIVNFLDISYLRIQIMKLKTQYRVNIDIKGI